MYSYPYGKLLRLFHADGAKPPILDARTLNCSVLWRLGCKISDGFVNEMGLYRRMREERKRLGISHFKPAKGEKTLEVVLPEGVEYPLEDQLMIGYKRKVRFP